MTRWLHYVGGYYSREKFVAEAQKLGVSRRIPANTAGAMEFGDIVGCLEWRGGEPEAFAEFRVTRISAPSEVAGAAVGDLLQSGRVTYQEGGEVVERECGEYIEGGSYTLAPDLTMQEMVARIKAVCEAAGVQPFLLLGGPLVKVYDPPFRVEPKPPFTRGFMRARNEAIWEAEPGGVVLEGECEVNEVRGIEQYGKRTTKDRSNLKLLTEAK